MWLPFLPEYWFPVVLWDNFFYPHFAPIPGNTVVCRKLFGCICTNSYPNVFLRRWGGCLALPQRRWGQLGLHNTTSDFVLFIRKTISCQEMASTPSRYKSKAKTEAKFRLTMPKSCLFGHINEFLFFFQFLHIWVVCTFLWEHNSHYIVPDTGQWSQMTCSYNIKKMLWK